MKTATFILAALVFGVFSTISISASSKLEKQDNDKQLTETIETLFQNAPLQDLMAMNEKSDLKVEFIIGNNNEINNVNVNCSNPELVHYAKYILTHTPIKVSPSFEHKKYSITIQFIMR